MSPEKIAPFFNNQFGIFSEVSSEFSPVTPGAVSKVNFIAVTSPAYEGAFRFEAAYRKGEV